MPPTVIALTELTDATGREFGPTEWLRIDQDRIDLFADASEDHQWIHVDPVRAAASPFGTTIAHGQLTLSLCGHFLSQMFAIEGASMAINYGMERVRFPSPVTVASRVRGTATIVAADEIPGGLQLKTQVTVEVDGGTKPACVAVLLTRLLR